MPSINQTLQLGFDRSWSFGKQLWESECWWICIVIVLPLIWPPIRSLVYQWRLYRLNQRYPHRLVLKAKNARDHRNGNIIWRVSQLLVQVALLPLWLLFTFLRMIIPKADRKNKKFTRFATMENRTPTKQLDHNAQPISPSDTNNNSDSIHRPSSPSYTTTPLSTRANAPRRSTPYPKNLGGGSPATPASTASTPSSIKPTALLRSALRNKQQSDSTPAAAEGSSSGIHTGASTMIGSTGVTFSQESDGSVRTEKHYYDPRSSPKQQNQPFSPLFGAFDKSAPQQVVVVRKSKVSQKEWEKVNSTETPNSKKRSYNNSRTSSVLFTPEQQSQASEPVITSFSQALKRRRHEGGGSNNAWKKLTLPASSKENKEEEGSTMLTANNNKRKLTFGNDGGRVGLGGKSGTAPSHSHCNYRPSFKRQRIHSMLQHEREQRILTDMNRIIEKKPVLLPPAQSSEGGTVTGHMAPANPAITFGGGTSTATAQSQEGTKGRGDPPKPAFTFGGGASTGPAQKQEGGGTAGQSAPPKPAFTFGGDSTSTAPTKQTGEGAKQQAAPPKPAFSFGGGDGGASADPTQQSGGGGTTPGQAAPAKPAFTFGGGGEGASSVSVQQPGGTTPGQTAPAIPAFSFCAPAAPSAPGSTAPAATGGAPSFGGAPAPNQPNFGAGAAAVPPPPALNFATSQMGAGGFSLGANGGGGAQQRRREKRRGRRRA